MACAVISTVLLMSCYHNDIDAIPDKQRGKTIQLMSNQNLISHAADGIFKHHRKTESFSPLFVVTAGKCWHQKDAGFINDYSDRKD